jgi:hypothetical protein
VSRKEAEEFAGERGLTYFEGSARTAENVREAIEKMAELVMQWQPAQETRIGDMDDAPERKHCC